MTPAEALEARDLITAHNSLRWNLARNGHRWMGLYAIDDDQNTSQPRLSPPMSRQMWTIAIALVEVRLRELGVEPEQGFERDCFDCNGTGKRPMD